MWIRSGTGAYAGFRAARHPRLGRRREVSALGAGVDPALAGRAVVINPSLDWGDDGVAQARSSASWACPTTAPTRSRSGCRPATCTRSPRALSFEEAAALPLAGLTAYRAVVSRAQVRAGETVLVTGIGGGVSTFALQIAARRGARVLVTSGSDAKLARARELGAAGGANYRPQDWPKEILALTGGRGPDVVIDSVGGETFARAVDLLRPGGRIATYGATTGPVRELVLRAVFWRQISVLGTTMGSPAEFGDMLDLYARAGLRPVVDRVFPLAEAAAAHRRMEEAGQFGKIVLSAA